MVVTSAIIDNALPEMPIIPEKFECLECGAILGAEDTSCPECGTEFDEYELEEVEELEQTDRGEGGHGSTN